LSPDTAASGKSTVVNVEWGKEPDEQFWRTVTKILKNMQEMLASPSDNAPVSRGG
jgi:hypothetical protein